jgi:hypothetical protein
MSLLVLGAIAAASALTGLLVGLRRRRLAPRKDHDDADVPPEAPAPATLDLKGLPLERGDVLVYASGDEAWLPGVTAFYDQGTHGSQAELALFVGPDAWVLAYPEPASALFRCEPIPLELGAEPPHILELEGAVYTRVRRLPLAARSEGEGAVLEGLFLVGIYRSAAGGELCVLLGERAKLMFIARKLITGSYDRYPGGLTLND